MSAPSELSLEFRALLSTTLFKWSKTLEDQISKSNAFLFVLMKMKKAYEKLDSLGERAAFPLMYELGQADAYSGYDVLDVTPTDGITAAFFEWRQASVPIAISGREQRLNRGEEKIISLLDSKTKQAKLGLQDFFNKRLLFGAGSSSITSAYTSGVTGAEFIDPLPKLVAYDPTASLEVGNINQSTHSWWRNVTKNSTSTTYAAFLKELRNAINNASKGPGGRPDLHLSDQAVYELYMAALASMHRNTSYKDADLPFENVALEGKPLTWDEYVPDVQGGSETQSTTSGTMFNLNTAFWGIQVDAKTNFTSTPFQKPENQDAEVAHILWMGAAGVSNRRKQGVIGGIDTTIAA